MHDFYRNLYTAPAQFVKFLSLVDVDKSSDMSPTFS